LIVEALARRALGQREQALLPLERALVMAQPGGFISSFIEHGAPMQELLRRAAVNSTVPLYAQKLLAAFQRTPSEKDQSALTQREMEILQLLAAGLSNRQMSEKLVISEATLKRHISNLYLKLDVHSRTQALVKAGELKLL
jgi:LuxR family maltose regulon positive regulatory protein